MEHKRILSDTCIGNEYKIEPNSENWLNYQGQGLLIKLRNNDDDKEPDQIQNKYKINYDGNFKRLSIKLFKLIN